MKNLHKSPGTGAPAALSTGHRHYLRHYHFHRLLVIFFRIFLLTGFLFLWEFCASHQIIDSFIFSSPSKIMNALLLMISDHSIFLHLGVTLYETFVSFFLVIFVSILFAILLWYSNNLPCRIKQPSEICTGPSSYCLAWRYKNHDHCNRNVRRYLRQYTQSVYQFPLYRSRKD